MASQAPVAARPAAPAGPSPIKIEMSEEVVQAQKAGRSKTMILAAVTAVVGLGIGYGVGGLAKANEGAQAAVMGAELLVKEVDAANTAVSELNDVLKAAASKVRNNEFPAEEIEKLGGMEIPFDGSNLMNKGIGRYNPTAVTMLLSYSSAVADVKEQKDKVRRLFGAVKTQFEETAKEAKEPKVHWAVAVHDGPKGKWAKVQPVEKAFLANDKKAKSWPSKLKVGKSELELYKKGDPESGQYIPVDPTTETAVCPQNLQLRLMGALMDLGKQIAGEKTPGHEKDGVVDIGEKVLDQLRRIGGPG